MGVSHYTISARGLLVLAKKVALKCLGAHDLTTAKRLRLCLNLLAETPRNSIFSDFAEVLSKLDINQQHYWIGTFYTLLLPASLRRTQATYFTPPHLSTALVRLVRQHGFDPLRHTAIDPAAGGAAFPVHPGRRDARARRQVERHRPAAARD